MPFNHDTPPSLEQCRQQAIEAKRAGIVLLRRRLEPDFQPRSRIGGLPALPDGVAWPRNSRTGLPLSFVAQIDLAEVPRPPGVIFPASGMLWFFVDFLRDSLEGAHAYRVLFDERPAGLAREGLQPPDDLPPMNAYDEHGWILAGHSRARIEPPTGLEFRLVDTYYDRPYSRRNSTTVIEQLWRHLRNPTANDDWHSPEELFAPGVYQTMIEALRDEAVARVLGLSRIDGDPGYWPSARCKALAWPRTAIEAEYALMAILSEFNMSLFMNEEYLPEDGGRALKARLASAVELLRVLGPVPLDRRQRRIVQRLVAEVRRDMARMNHARDPSVTMDDRLRYAASAIGTRVRSVYPFIAHDTGASMPDAPAYLPAELLDRYADWRCGGAFHLHQMFGHASSPQGAPDDHQGDVLLLQIGGSRSLGLPLSLDAVLHFWITRRDLAAGRFDRVEASWEAG